MNQIEYNHRMAGYLEDVTRLAQQQETLHQKLNEVESKILILRVEYMTIGDAR